MTSITLRAIAAEYLRYKRHCPIVAFERSHWPCSMRPDVIGVTKKRKIVEIEIKCSMADFRANAKKHSEYLRWKAGLYQPHQYYFLVPPEMVEKVKSELPSHAGLMSVIKHLSVYSKLPELTVHVVAKINPMAAPISAREMVDLVLAQSGTLCALARDVAKFNKSHPSNEQRMADVVEKFEVGK
jgi:hypothetical protein